MSRWRAQMHEADHLANIMRRELSARPWVVVDTHMPFAWPIYYCGERVTETPVRFKTEAAAQECADRLNTPTKDRPNGE